MLKSIKTGVLAAVLVSTAIFAHAQKKISEGSVTFGVSYSLTPEQEPMASMLPTETKVKFNGNMSRFELQQGPATITVISDNVSFNSLVLIDVPVAQMQIAVKGTKEDYEKEKANDPKFSDFKATGEKQKILTYNAEKYTYKDDKGGTYELWATNDIELPAGLMGQEFKEVKGTPIKFTKFNRGVKSTSTIKALNEEAAGPFTLDVPKGYDLKTMEEVMQMQGGGQ
ncbi:DUF4412 domain-containing protein [Pedobacter steynii]|uniref:Uncharacterized protein n=1 Tax=Pedobacter steynii TaxID=430522 RepID=A0A1D7QK17_9SPHI|nr:DUF4412 domain-containing protein [Pedobacter steynii]AOM79005.1 hypothetical protein BFS30_18615 [Pedobacter steynii]